MAETYTSNLELVKPDYDSPADISVINSNMDKIDNAVANAGKVKSVNDKTGDVTLTAADVGALPSGGTAVNANALNGKNADQYALKTDLPTKASDIGALPSDGTAADSEKLGGVAASEYAKKTDIPESGGVDLLTAYPVGSIYMSINETSPASLFGGTWEQIHGRFLLASGSPDANTDNWFGDITGGWSAGLGSTGGQDYHTLTVEEMPSHTHESQYVAPQSGENVAGMMGSTEANWWSPDYIRATGGGQKHNNMPPYLAVNVWKRVS